MTIYFNTCEYVWLRLLHSPEFYPQLYLMAKVLKNMSCGRYSTYLHLCTCVYIIYVSILYIWIFWNNDIHQWQCFLLTIIYMSFDV